MAKRTPSLGETQDHLMALYWPKKTSTSDDFPVSFLYPSCLFIFGYSPASNSTVRWVSPLVGRLHLRLQLQLRHFMAFDKSRNCFSQHQTETFQWYFYKGPFHLFLQASFAPSKHLYNVDSRKSDIFTPFFTRSKYDNQSPLQRWRPIQLSFSNVDCFQPIDEKPFIYMRRRLPQNKSSNLFFFPLSSGDGWEPKWYTFTKQLLKD